MATIVFKNGNYKLRGKPININGMGFELVEDFRSKTGTDDGYVLVNGSQHRGFPEHNIRIKCRRGEYEIAGVSRTQQGEHVLELKKNDNTIDFTQRRVDDSAVAHETDEQIKNRLRERFEVLKDMTGAVKAGDVRAMIVTGPPGVGKSFGVQEVLSKEDVMAKLADRPPKYEFVKGAMSAIGLYSKLFAYSKRDEVLVFDDCDSILLDDLSLNILKAALDSSKKRTICWNTDSRVLRSEGIPPSFEYKGGCIFITNLKFENVRSKKLQDHLAALESRCHYIDLQMDTDREKVLRIEQIVEDGMLDTYDFDRPDIAKDELLEYINTNRGRLRELSLRTVLKIADLRKSFPLKWKAMAEVTVMRRSA